MNRFLITWARRAGVRRPAGVLLAGVAGPAVPEAEGHRLDYSAERAAGDICCSSACRPITF